MEVSSLNIARNIDAIFPKMNATLHGEYPFIIADLQRTTRISGLFFFNDGSRAENCMLFSLQRVTLAMCETHCGSVFIFSPQD